MTTAVSGGHVWRFPNETSSNASSKPKVAKKNIVFLILSSLIATVGAIIMCMAKPIVEPSIATSSTEGAIPVAATASNAVNLPATPAIAMIAACIISMVFLMLAGKERGLMNLSRKTLLLSFASIIIPLIVMVVANFSLFFSALNQTKNLETSQWVQEHYDLTLTEPIDADSGSVEAKSSDGNTVKLNVLQFNGSTYIYRNDAELLSIMDKIKK